MAHPHLDDVRKSHGDKLNAMVGKRGEHPTERAERIADVGKNEWNQDPGSHQPEEVWVGAPARQVSNFGNVKGK